MPGRKTGRHHVVFSNIERGTLLAAQWLDDVTDLREQYPLWPLAETMAIADELAVSHPAHNDGTPVLMTTDLVLTVRGVEQRLQPIAVKPSRQLAELRTLEKLEIERIYWKRRGCRWQIVTELELPEQLIQNLNWVDEYYSITDENLAPDEIRALVDHLYGELAKGAFLPLRRSARPRTTGSATHVARH
ncbi:MAG: TnsA endonuclease N-terminal domain-containing protein [Bryobacteraceae bacterium]